ncbi:BTB/POZ domain-containing protein At5g03250-like [Nicotiana tabacum]|uniref:BTB/POZ domain-containing protein At5g03250-like n=1 Tax=Nicotiana tabacum TaxID=4097 RepID=A0A1S4A177_TOBAC|nr:PREDICTED: BTB/POZ domain-containing protein At5g03250-like [Nicotiana tabacum]
MAFVKLGSKSEAFRREGQAWHCTSGLPSDVTIEIGEMSFYLHKFPLISRSGLLAKLIKESSNDDGSVCVLQLSDIPGGAKAFELVAKFCYGVKIELTPLNIVSLRCASEYLQMTEETGDGNLITQTEVFLNDVFGNWTDTIKALETCEEVLPHAEELHIVSRCINSLAMKACTDTKLFNWPVSENDQEGSTGADIWNGISAEKRTQPLTDDWWYEDVSFLSLPLYKRLIQAVEAGGMRPENIAGALVFYAKKYIPLMNRQASFKDAPSHTKSGSTISTPSEADQRVLLEEIMELLPNQKGVTETRFLLRLLRTAMMLQASPSCRENLERRVGLQLDQAALDDVLIPNMGYSVETLYDIDCFQRILDHFMSIDQASSAPSPCFMEENQLMEGSLPLTSLTRVSNLVDSYLAEVAPDVNFKFPKFQSLAATIPDFARPLSDGIYRAIDIYLKAHPWLTDSEREQICRLMNCQKLSLEACTHAAQNERLPLRVIVQVLFFEQLRLRTSISGWFFVSDNLDNSQSSLRGGNRDTNTANGMGSSIDDVRERVAELEKECNSMKQEFKKVVKTKKRWNVFCGKKSQCDLNTVKPCKIQPPPVNEHKNHKKGDSN